jgi:hypothetical protein
MGVVFSLGPEGPPFLISMPTTVISYSPIFLRASDPTCDSPTIVAITLTTILQLDRNRRSRVWIAMSDSLRSFFFFLSVLSSLRHVPHGLFIASSIFLDSNRT